MSKKENSKSTNRCLLFAIGWTILILYASTYAGAEVRKIPVKIEGLDKIAHIILYFVFSYLWVHVLYRYKIINMKVIVFLVAALLGIGMELVQYYFFVDRSFEFADIIANIMGSFIGVTLLNRIKFIKLC